MHKNLRRRTDIKCEVAEGKFGYTCIRRNPVGTKADVYNYKDLGNTPGASGRKHGANIVRARGGKIRIRGLSLGMYVRE